MSATPESDDSGTFAKGDAADLADDPAVCWEANAETWTKQTRAGYDVYRDHLNTPAFLRLLPPVRGLSGLDIGCGEGNNTRAVARLGARMTALDISPTFIRHAMAKELEEPLGIDYHEGDARQLPFADAGFDFVVAFMSMMDVGDPKAALAEAARVLRPGGFFQFSILHPCFMPPTRKVLRDETGTAYAIRVADYFKVGPWVDTWWFGAVKAEDRKNVPPFRVPYTHLTLSGWLDALTAAGFTLRKLGEPTADAETARRVPEVADTQIAPIFLHFQATLDWDVYKK